MLRCTPTQYRVLMAIRAHIDENGHSPTCSQIGAFLGISRQAASKHVAALEKRGYLTKIYWQQNSFEIVEGER